MLSPIGRFLRSAPPAPNAAPGLPAPELVRDDVGHVDWGRTMKGFAAHVMRLGLPEATQGFGRLAGYVVALVGGEPDMDRAVGALLTGDGFVVERAASELGRAYESGGLEGSSLARWVRGIHDPLDPERQREVGGAANGHLIFWGLRDAMNSVTEGRGTSWRRAQSTEDALLRLTRALIAFGEGLGAPEALAVAHGLLDPRPARPAPCGLTAVARRSGSKLQVTYARDGRPVLRAVVRLDSAAIYRDTPHHWLSKLDPASRARPTAEDYDGAVADLVRRGVRVSHSTLDNADAEAAVTRAGFVGSPAEIRPGAVAALSVMFPAPWY